MKAIIIEDNREAADKLKSYLKQFCPKVTVLGSSGSIKESIQLIAKLNPDLLFLDIKLSDGSAFDMLHKLPNPHFRIIFTTAYNEYAIKAIKHSAIDFLLKPIDPEDLIIAVQKAQKELEKEDEIKKIKHLLDVWKAKEKTIPSILLRDQYGIQVIYIKEIIHLESHGNYTNLILNDQAPFMATGILKEIESYLPEEDFFRCHQSHIINLNFLLRYDKRNSDVLFLKNGDKVPLAVRRKNLLIKKLQQRSK